jgi:type I protein arginine methyltransferase
MLPDRAQIYIAAIEDEPEKRRRSNFWKNQYGVDMSIMTNVALKEPCIDYLNAFGDQRCYDMICSDSYKIVDLDLVHMKKGDVNFSSKYELKFNTSTTASALISWFDCKFENFKNKITLSTSPYKPYTHWKNVIFYIDRACYVKEGDSLTGSIAVRQAKENHREIDVKVSYHFSHLPESNA